MKVITMESSAYKEMMAQIANIAGYIREARDEKKRKRVEKPRDFDPFGQTGFAHLWLQYDCPFKVLVLGVNFILPF